MRAFSLQPAAAAAHVLALDQLSARGGTKPGAGAKSGGWTAEVLGACEEQLARYVEAHDSQPGSAWQQENGGEDAGMTAADERAAIAVFTAGEVCAILRSCLSVTNQVPETGLSKG